MASVSRPRVLLVDDLETNRFLLEEALGEIGADIVSVGAGKRALEIVSASHPEVVVLDFQMPDLNGAEVARRIKLEPGAPFTYIVLMSGYQEAEQTATIRESLADRFLGKPYKLSEIRSAVEEGLRIAADRRG
ncbi:MAG: response regulator [Candidatus Binatia bacterium]